MSKHKVEYVDKKMAIEFLASTLKEMREAGIMVAVKNVAEREGRPAGIIIFAGDMQLADGVLSYLDSSTEKVVQAAVE